MTSHIPPVDYTLVKICFNTDSMNYLEFLESRDLAREKEIREKLKDIARETTALFKMIIDDV